MSLAGLRSGESHGVRSECAGCGLVFCGVAPFDQHRRNATAAELAREPWMVRRCWTEAEMVARGFSRCPLDRWGGPPPGAPRTKSPRKARVGAASVPAARRSYGGVS